MVIEYLEEKPIIPKNKYIAIVGDMFISEEVVREIAKELGFSKSNLRFFSHYHLNSDEFESISSENCVVIIMGPVPHKTNGNFQNVFAEKIIKAKTKSNQLKISKDSIEVALCEVLQKLK
jgi:hypothetical protein